MRYITNLMLSVSGKNNYIRYIAKQYDKKSRVFICTLSDNSSRLTVSNTAKAIAYNKNKETIDIIDCTISVSAQTITFTLSDYCLARSGTLYVDVSIFESDTIKLTCGTIVIDVIASADVDTHAIPAKSYYKMLVESAELAERFEDIEVVENAGKILVLDSNGKITTQIIGEPSAEQVETAVVDYLTAHPELTTTVEDGSVTIEKLSNDLKDTVISKKADIGTRISKKLGASAFISTNGYDEDTAKKEIKAFADAGFDKVVFCIHDRYADGTNDTGGRDVTVEEDTNWYFSQTVDEIELFTDYANSLGLEVSIKIHTKYANEQIGDNTLVEGWQEHHLKFLNALATKNLNIAWITDFNESANILSNSEYQEFVLSCFEVMKTIAKTGISFNKSTLKVTLPDIVGACDFIALNTYPPAGFSTVENAQNTTISEMVEAFKWSGVKEYLQYISSDDYTGKEIVITEIGCGRYWENFASPEKTPTENERNTWTNSDFESRAKYADAVLEYLKSSVTTEINFWYTRYDYDESDRLGKVIKKWKGETV